MVYYSGGGVILDYTNLQTRALRTFTIPNYNSHTEPLCIKLLNILKLTDLYQLELCKLHFKIQREQVPD